MGLGSLFLSDQLIVALVNPDLVLSDIRMPGTQGLDLLAHLKKRSLQRRLLL